MLDDRKQAFENKFKMDEEFRFKVQARAVRYLGMWVAAQLGLEGAEAIAYAEEVVEADFHEPGVKDVFRKVMADLSARGIEMTEHHIEKQFSIHMEEAKTAMMSA